MMEKSRRRIWTAMPTAAKRVYSHITKSPGVRGGKACIDNTRITVADIAALLKAGKTTDEMLVAYPSLNKAQVHAAISYCYENREEIEAVFAQDEAAEAEHERRQADCLARRDAK
jgi:uncharacterized protein (DUF433 family)